ncbi:MAG: LapA family protein [Bacteroidota bacterium]|nr:LapA family protein [Bacteroidota bacterium]
MKKTLYIIITLLLLIIVIIFTLQNSKSIDVSLIFFTAHSSLALVLFLTFMVGILVGSFSLLPTILHHKKQFKRIKKEIKNLKDIKQSSDLGEFKE